LDNDNVNTETWHFPTKLLFLLDGQGQNIQSRNHSDRVGSFPREENKQIRIITAHIGDTKQNRKIKKETGTQRHIEHEFVFRGIFPIGRLRKIEHVFLWNRR
jgi:hypothetical protein